MASTKGSSCVMSLRLASVRITLKGTPPVSTRRWCLLPTLRRSVGFGPVFFPHARHAPTNYRPPRETSPACLPHEGARAAPGAACPTRPPLAIGATDASNSCQNRSLSPEEGFPKQCPFTEQTRCQSVPCGHPGACDQSSDSDVPPLAATVQSTTTIRHLSKAEPYSTSKSNFSVGRMWSLTTEDHTPWRKPL